MLLTPMSTCPRELATQCELGLLRRMDVEGGPELRGAFPRSPHPRGWSLQVSVELSPSSAPWSGVARRGMPKTARWLTRSIPLHDLSHGLNVNGHFVLPVV